jgi:ABC-2 type transport system permease protein
VPGEAVRSSLPRALRAELTKARALRSVRVHAALQIGGLALFGVAGLYVGGDEGPTTLGQTVTFGADTVPLFAALIGVLLFSGDFAQGALAYTLLASPSRAVVLLAKGITVALIAVFAGSFGVLLSALAVFGAASFRPERPPVDLAGDLAKIGAYLVVSILYALLGLSIGAAVRSMAGSVFALLGVVWALPIAAAVAGIWLPFVNDAIAPHSPAALTLPLINAGDDWMPALVSFAAWPVALSVVGWVRLRRSALR